LAAFYHSHLASAENFITSISETHTLSSIGKMPIPTSSTTKTESGPTVVQSSTTVPTGAGVDTGAGTTRAKTEAEIEADRLYEERIEEEYAKREGGA
jgi:hypothetical protein